MTATPPVPPTRTEDYGGGIKPPPIVRPNGKIYRPRRVVVHLWDNDSTWDQRAGAVVLGTHDIDRARPLAEQACKSAYGTTYVIKPDVDWFRDAFVYGDRGWLRDEVRGAAGVMFTAADDPEETP